MDEEQTINTDTTNNLINNIAADNDACLKDIANDESDTSEQSEQNSASEDEQAVKKEESESSAETEAQNTDSEQDNYQNTESNNDVEISDELLSSIKDLTYICTTNKELIEEILPYLQDIADVKEQLQIIQQTQAQQAKLNELDNVAQSILAEFAGIKELKTNLDNINTNISSSVNNLQEAMNGINTVNTNYINALNKATVEIPQKLSDNLTSKNEQVFEAAVKNFNTLNAASNKWIKSHGERASQNFSILNYSNIAILVLVSVIFMYLLFTHR